MEASADIAEETVNARHVIPRTMFYALTASILIEFGMYVVYVLAIKDAGAAVLALVAFTLVCAALIFLPQFAGNGYAFSGVLWCSLRCRR